MRPKTHFVDIDGCIFGHRNEGASRQWHDDLVLLPGVITELERWEKAGDHIVLTTARPEGLRSCLVHQLQTTGVIYHQLVMGVTSGHRIIYNDIKPEGGISCSAVNLVRNQGLQARCEATMGILLAAGAAERMPNKLMLVSNEGEAIIESGVKFLQRSQCSRIVVVISPGSLIPLYLQKYELEYAIQRTPRGVLDALMQVDKWKRRVIIAFGDNVYPEDESCPTWLAPPAASVRRVAGDELDGYDFEISRWVHRSEEPDYKLAGWYLLANTTPDRDNLAMLNSLEAKPFICQPNGWYDVGTPSSYEDYIT